MILHYHLFQKIYQQHHRQIHHQIRFLYHRDHRRHHQEKLSSKKLNYLHYFLDLLLQCQVHLL